MTFDSLNFAAEVGGLSASTGYEYQWELVDTSGNKTLTSKVSFTTQAANDPFFIENQVTSTNVTSGFANVHLNLQQAAKLGSTFYYRKAGETTWRSVVLPSVSAIKRGEICPQRVLGRIPPTLCGEQNGTVSVFGVGLSANTDYEYEVKLVDRGKNEVRYGTYVIVRKPPAVTAQSITSLRASIATFNFTADETIAKATLKITKTSDGSVREIIYDNLNKANLAAEVSGLIASTGYEYQWELVDTSGNKTLTSKVAFTTAATDEDPFFIENRVTGYNLSIGFYNLKLHFESPVQSGFRVYRRKVGSSTWSVTTVNIAGGATFQEGTLAIYGSLQANTLYEYKVEVDYYDATQTLVTKTSQIQSFSTGSS